MKQSIWVLDDEESVQTLTENIITVLDTEDEFEVKKFFSAAVVLAQLSYSLPDILLIDLSLKGLNGLEFLEIISTRMDISRIDIYVVSNSADEYSQTKAMQSGVINKYIQKPMNLINMEKILNQRRILNH